MWKTLAGTGALLWCVGAGAGSEYRPRVVEEGKLEKEIYRLHCEALPYRSSPAVMERQLTPEQMEGVYLLAYACSPLDARWGTWPQREDVAIRRSARSSGESVADLRKRTSGPSEAVTAALREGIYYRSNFVICASAKSDVALYGAKRAAILRSCAALDELRRERWFVPNHLPLEWRPEQRGSLVRVCESMPPTGIQERLRTPFCECQLNLRERSVPERMRETPWRHDPGEAMLKYCAAAVAAVDAVRAHPLEPRETRAERAARAGHSAGDQQLQCESEALAQGASFKKATEYCFCVLPLSAGLDERTVNAVAGLGSGDPTAEQLDVLLRVWACDFAAAH